MGDAFNPYSHWLKLPPQRWKPTYYEILGIERGEKDKDTIIAVGKKLYAEIKAAPLAGREKEHRALLSEIEEAVRTFASNSKRKAYDDHLNPAVGDSNADTKLLGKVPTALAAPAAPIPMPMSSQAAPSAASTQGAQPAAKPKSAFAMPPMAAPALASAPAALPASIQPVAIQPVAAPRPIATSISMPVAQPVVSVTKSDGPPALAIRTQTSAKSLSAATADRHRQERARQNSILIAMSLGGILLVGSLGVIFRGEIAKAIASAPATPPESNGESPTKTTTIKKPDAESPPSDGGEAKPIIPSATGQDTPPEMTSDSKPEMKPEMPPETKPETPPVSNPETKPEIKPEPKPETTPPPAPMVFTAENAAKLKSHCEAIITALKSRNAASAATELESAETLATPPEAKSKIDQLATIVGPYRAFWTAFDEAWKALKAGDDVAVGASTKVKVVSITETEIEIEIGANKRKQTKDTLSTGLLLGLVRTKLDLDTPDGKLALAIFHLTDKSGNADEGGKLLAEASTSGLNPENVKALLETPFEFASLVTDSSPPVTQPTETPPITDAPSNSDVEELVKKLRAALTSRNMPAATKLAAEIEKLSTAPGASPKLAAEAQLATYTGHFWSYVEKGIASFKGTEEIMVNDEVALVIEAGKNKLVCRIRGKRTEYNLQNIPAPLALAIVEMTADKTSADYELSRGALFFTQKDAPVEKAKEAWESAKSKGAEAADLLLTLIP